MTTRNSRRTYPVKNILPMPKKAVCLCGFCNSCGAAKSAKSLKSRKIQKKKVKKPMIVVMTQKPLVGTRRHARLNAWERKPGPDEIKNKFSIHRTAAEHESSADDLWWYVPNGLPQPFNSVHKKWCDLVSSSVQTSFKEVHPSSSLQVCRKDVESSTSTSAGSISHGEVPKLNVNVNQET